MSKKIRTRKDRLRHKIIEIVGHNDTYSVNSLLTSMEEYEQNNLDTIEKLKRDKKITMNAINGGLKQAINAHGPITKQLIGSVGKRIYGSLLTSEKIKKKISIKVLLIGILIGSLITIIIL